MKKDCQMFSYNRKLSLEGQPSKWLAKKMKNEERKRTEKNYLTKSKNIKSLARGLTSTKETEEKRAMTQQEEIEEGSQRNA